MPVVRVASEESVEVLETQSTGPLVEGTIWAFQPVRNQMVLANPGCVVTVADQNVADGARALRKDRVVAWITRGELRNVAEADAVVVTASEERGSRGRA